MVPELTGRIPSPLVGFCLIKNPRLQGRKLQLDADSGTGPGAPTKGWRIYMDFIYVIYSVECGAFVFFFGGEVLNGSIS